MTTVVQTQSEYRNLPLAQLQESPANPRKVFDEAGLQELAASITAQGVLSPLLVRPVNSTHGYEIVAGARRYRAAQLAGIDSVPVRIVELTDAQALEVSIIENLQRSQVHPLDEATGYVALMRLDYSVEQIAAKVGKPVGYVLSRNRLADLAPAVTEAFAKDEIGVGHALLLLSMHNQADAARVLRDAAQVYKVDVDAISATVKQEFAAKEKAKANKMAAPKSQTKPAKTAAA